MSLLPTCYAVSPDANFNCIQNIGGQGTGVADAPVIKGTTLGTVIVGDASDGLRLRGDTTSANANAVFGGQANGGSLSIGNSVASPSQVVLTDGTATVNGILSVPGSFFAKTAGSTPVAFDTFVSRDIHGFSDTGYASFQVAGAGGGPIANPSAIAPGLHAVVLIGSGAGNEQAQPSGVFFWTGTSWTGNAVSFAFTAGAPNCAIGPVAGGATLNVGGASIPANYTVVFRQLLALP